MGRIESEFHRFVRPKKHPKLSTCCIQLTGITQQQIDQSNPFPEVYQDFLKWLDELTNRKQLVFYTKENFKRQVGQNVTFCSWSSFDMRHYFQLGMVRHEIDRPDNMGIWIDMQHEIQVFSRKFASQTSYGALFECHIFSLFFAKLERKWWPVAFR